MECAVKRMGSMALQEKFGLGASDDDVNSDLRKGDETGPTSWTGENWSIFFFHMSKITQKNVKGIQQLLEMQKWEAPGNRKRKDGLGPKTYHLSENLNDYRQIKLEQ